MSEKFAKIDRWISYKNMDTDNLSELIELKKNAESEDIQIRQTALEEINDRFYKELEFGTGGLRGLLGAGSNRMNIYTVRKATIGVAKYINAHYEKPSAAIGYDSRINSELFAKTVAETFLACNIDVYLYNTLMPVPALSFATRYHKCAVGIMITASHNPYNYNGYKVYDENGCQVTDSAAEEIFKYISETDIFEEPESKEAATLTDMKEETKNAFYEAVIAEKMAWASESEMRQDLASLSVVYTPLNGAGNIPVRTVLGKIGVNNIHIVAEQELPDGNFPTCPYPNPEKKEALEKGLECFRKVGADLLIATDPDSDRVGIAIATDAGEMLPNGNEVGILLLDFICTMRTASKTMPENPVAVRTIVSSKMADRIAEAYGVSMKTTLTGFKYIGETITELASRGRERDYIFGFEESTGYLSGTYVRDKDAVNAAMLICQMAAYYKKQGKTLAERLAELYETYGYFLSSLIEFTFEGEKGMRKIAGIMDALRKNPINEIAGQQAVQTIDYKEMSSGLPKANVIEAILENGGGFIVRPSGTEPKLKIYLSAKCISKKAAEDELELLEKEITLHINKN